MSSFAESLIDDRCLWEMLAHLTNNCVAILDHHGRVLYANEAKARLLGIALDELVGSLLRDHFGEEYAQERLQMIRQVLDTGLPLAIRSTVRGWRGVTRLRPLEDADGKRRLVLAVHYPVALGFGALPARGEVVVEARHADGDLIADLTDREVAILRHIASGLTMSEIAKSMHRTIKTMEWHRASLGQKLGAANRVELVRIAIKAGLCPLIEVEI